MIRWRGKSDGFEWHKHIRTTIRIRRENRRQRIDEAQQFAVEGVKGAGRAGAAAGRFGLSFAGRVLCSAASALAVAFSRMIAALPPAWRRMRAVGVEATLLAVHIASQRLMEVMPARQTGRLSMPRMAIPLPSARAASLLATAAVAGVAVLGGGWLVWQGATQLASAASTTSLFSRTIEGRAEAIAGDILRIGKAEIRLEGIEAPEPLQRCSIPGNRRWRCGTAARRALARTLGHQLVSCRVSGTDETGRALGTCLAGDRDLAQALVRAGLAFAEAGLFSKYGSAEEEARAQKAGLWRGKAERPSEYRARIAEEMARAWEAAKQRAPRGCPIKGRIASGRKYYVLPGTVDYRRTRIHTRRGERWFCSEKEALAAGWKRSPRS